MKLVAGSLLLCSLTGAARADLVNGGFESGDFRGWQIEKKAASPDAATVSLGTRDRMLTAGEPIFDYADNIATANYSPGLPMRTSPTQGQRNAVFLQNGPATVRLTQTIDLARGAHLSWDLAYHNWAAPAVDQRVRASLHDPTTNEMLATLLDTRDAAVDQPMTHFSFDLSAFEGRRAVLAFEIAAHTSYLDVQLDDVQLTSARTASGDGTGRGDASLDEMVEVDDGVAVGGCSAGGGSAGLVVAAALAALRRRRR